MWNILVPIFFGFVKKFRFSFFPPPVSVQLYCLSYISSSRSKTSFASLRTLNHFKTSFMILNKKYDHLFGFTLASSDVRCQGTEY